MATFCLVHGAWHGGWAWGPLRAELEARGHDVVARQIRGDDAMAARLELRPDDLPDPAAVPGTVHEGEGRHAVILSCAL